MAMEAGLKSREYQKFKDKEEFFTVSATSTAGSIVTSDNTHVRDILLNNTGSTTFFYNLGVSGGGVNVSTSGLQLDPSQLISYGNVGFTTISYKTAASIGELRAHVIYDTN